MQDGNLVQNTQASVPPPAAPDAQPGLDTTKPPVAGTVVTNPPTVTQKKDDRPIAGPVIDFIGDLLHFGGMTGVAVVAVGFLAQLIGIWAIPALIVAGAGSHLLGNYLTMRKLGRAKEYSVMGALFGYPVNATGTA